MTELIREQVAALLDGADESNKDPSTAAYRAKLRDAAPNLARQLLAAMDRLADADMAQTALVERAAGIADAAAQRHSNAVCDCAADGDRAAARLASYAQGAVEAVAEELRALAPDAGVKDLAALRARVTSLSQQVDTIAAHRDEVEADNSRLAAELAEARKQAEALREAGKALAKCVNYARDMLQPESCSRFFSMSDAALAALPPPGGDDEGEGVG